MSNPFENHQLALVGGRAEQIEKILAALGRSKFEHITALAETVAARLTEAEQRDFELAVAEYKLAKTKHSQDKSGRPLDGSGRLLKKPKQRRPVSKVTLLRNDKYATLLINHLVKLGMIPKKSSGPKAKSMDAFSADLDIRNKQIEIDRLHRYIEKLHEANETSGKQTLPIPEEDPDRVELDKLREKVGLLARAIHQIVEYPYLREFFHVDPDSRIIDVAKGLRREGPLVGPKEAEAYFDVISSSGYH